jgi:hypothetical protein
LSTNELTRKKDQADNCTVVTKGDTLKIGGIGSMRNGTQYSSQRGDQAREQGIQACYESATATRATLQTWKEIASELNCGVRTVQRWERTLGLPVRRLGKGPRGRVVAFKDDLQRWLRDSAKARAMQKVGLPSIIDLLARGSSSAKPICDKCHSPMKFLDGHFWIYGTNRKWNLSLPFCPRCDAEALERLDRCHCQPVARTVGLTHGHA